MKITKKVTEAGKGFRYAQISIYQRPVTAQPNAGIGDLPLKFDYTGTDERTDCGLTHYRGNTGEMI
jgi:hypothetical protein